MYLLLLIPIAYVIIFKYASMVGLVMAFQDYDYSKGFFGSEWVGLENFRRFFQSYKFGLVLKNTLSISLYSLLLFPLPILFALMLNAFPGKRYKKMIQTVTYLPHFFSVVIMVGLLFQILNHNSGMYGSVYRLLTGSVAPNLLAKAKLFPHIYVWSGIWQNLGYNSILYVAALSSVDDSLHEAARIDGASRFQRLRYIDIPGIMPTVSIMLILAVGGIMGVGHEKALLMQNSLNLSYSEIISTYEYKIGLASGRNDFSLSVAIGLFNSVVNFILLLSANRISKKVSGNSVF